jgi:hypothetical protein
MMENEQGIGFICIQNLVMRVEEWVWTSWRLPSHPVSCVCICYRCVWKRVHAQFWRDVICIAMSDSDTCASGHSEDEEQFNVPAPFIVPESFTETQIDESVRVPYSAPLPGPPLASIPPGSRIAHDRLKPAFSCTFPNLHRVYEKSSSKAIAHIAWDFASAHEIWSIATCPFLGSGSKRTMTWYKNEATKFVHEFLSRVLPAAQQANSPSATAWAGLVKTGHMDWTFPEFNLACSHPNVLGAVRTRMQTYNKTKMIYIKNGLFEDATSVQIDKCRLAALMVEPQMFAFLAAKSNPSQSRDHSDNPMLRATNINELCMKEMTRLHNDPEFVPAANANITSWAPDFFVNTGQAAEKRDYGWISTEFTSMKSEMGALMSNFNKSGDLANESDDSTRDALFWNNYCKKQPLWMYIYMLWDHGRDSRYAWNAIILPDNQRMEFGLREANQVPSQVTMTPPRAATNNAQAPNSQTTVKGRKRTNAALQNDTTDDNLLQASVMLLHQFQQNPKQVRDADTSTQESRNTDRAKALSDHADIINHQLTKLPDGSSTMRDKLLHTLEGIINQLCDISGK